MRRLRLIPVVAAAIALGACGGDDDTDPGPRPTAFHSERYGYHVTIPPGWQRARARLADVYDPREILAVSTFTPATGREGCTHLPARAVAEMPRDGVLVEVQERAGSPTSEFVPRPARFTPAMGTSDVELPACVPDPPRFTQRWIPFRDRRRWFYALVVVGRDAPPTARDEAYELLDSLRFDPRRKAGWEPAGD